MARISVMLLSALALLCLAGPRAEAADVTFSLNFSDYAGGPPLQWLAQKGFTPKRDAGNQSRVVLSGAGKQLGLETKKQAAGLLLNEANIPDYSKIRVEWGVNAFPPGASYVKGVRSEAVMVFVFFGDKKLASGSLLIPDSPYFIGLFLCDSDPVDQAFTGRYFKAGGRYVCVDRAAIGQPVVTEYPIAAAFTRLFAKSPAPEITGLGMAIDTESAKGNGVAKSFIRKIEFVK